MAVTQYFIDSEGNYLGAFDGEGVETPPDGIEVPEAPHDARQVWLGEAWSEVEALPPPMPAVISDRQFFQGLAVAGVITNAEALAAVKTGAIPSGMVALITGLPEAARFGAEMLLSGATEFKRAHPLTSAFGAGFGWTEQQIDNFWISASTL
ncbi:MULTISPECIES: hypothetical protein [unclassified Mesorhizobium]|uniref:hypothetical protein n=1 Tax=unclassified Mesorhizobium TaxID=325217 RepID=UPI0033398964